jgi:predicted esterase
MRTLLTLALSLVSVTPLWGQPQRYELGRRLKAFEAEWDKIENPDARKRALSDLPKLTTQFFSLQLGEAARTLDLALHALKTDIPPTAAQQFIWSLAAVPESRIVDDTAKELSVVIQPLYSIKGSTPKQLELQLWFTDKQVVKIQPEQFPVTVKVPLPALNGSMGLDRKLYFLADGAQELRPAAIGISQIANFQKRLDVLRKATEGSVTTIEQATARERALLLSEVAAKPSRVPETDLPFAELLANAEAMLDEKPFFTAERHGQFWMSVPLASGKVVPCRVLVPKGLNPKKPIPVVFALHGAGVNENMFFESYGAGRIVKECEERGWLLVAPRSSGFGSAPPVLDLFSKLAERYPLDAKSVFLVGHSMGAGQAISLAQASPDQFAGVAALGGGSRPAKPEALAKLPVFVGIGLRDTIGLSGAQALNKTLLATGAKNLTYKEYPHVEHLVIVGAALPDVFRMFDRVLKN